MLLKKIYTPNVDLTRMVMHGKHLPNDPVALYGCLYIYICVHGHWQSGNACILIHVFCLDGKRKYRYGISRPWLACRSSSK